MKTCAKCLIEKKDIDFSVQWYVKKKTAEKSYRLYIYCKSCVRLKSKSYRDSYTKEQWEHIHKMQSDWHQTNYVSHVGMGTTEVQKIKNKNYRLANPEKIKELQRKKKRRYIDTLSPSYVKEVIRKSFKDNNINISTKDISAELVEIKTKQLKSCRTLRGLRN
jgi:hypothetical protein